MTQSLRADFGERVMLARRRKKLSQPELAQRAGMSVTALNRVENGHQSLYMETVASLAQALSVSADYLLGLNGETDEVDEASVPPSRPRQHPLAAAGAQP